MKKTEKLKKLSKMFLYYTDTEKYLLIDENRLKINEIIDVLNSRLFEPTITVPSPDQKQPEGKYKKGDKVKITLTDKEGWINGECYVGGVEEPEKQEEWREEIRRIVYIRPSNIGDADSLTREVLEIIDQLLSERTEEAREEGRNEVLNNKLFIGDYDVARYGLNIRTVNRENYLAQIYKYCKEKYDWAFGTSTYEQALKRIENSLSSALTPYVGLDKMVDEARVEVLSKLKEEE